MGKRVVIIGGGLAGLAAAVALAPRGWRVTLLEAKSRLGGRAGSFVDAASGQLIDACQHVSMGCCTAFAAFASAVGIDHLIERQQELHFMTPDGRVSRWRPDPLPAPLHLARPFAWAHFLTLKEKMSLGLALAALRRLSPKADPPLLPWLEAHGQTPRLIDRFWSVVLVSALNESVDRIGLKYARKVFVDAFLTDRRGGDVEIPTVPLARLYGDELRSWLRRHRVEVRLDAAVKQVHVERDAVAAVELRSGETLEADAYVLSVPWHRVPALLPEETVEEEPSLTGLAELKPSTITSVHLWHDRPLTTLPHLVLLEATSQWLFLRGETAPGEFYSQVVVSAAGPLRSLGHEEIRRRVVAELDGLFSKAGAKLLRARVVTEPQATFSVRPGVDVLRPPQRSPIRKLFLAGDWTRTGWPATMEGAVRSGWLAAREVARD